MDEISRGLPAGLAAAWQLRGAGTRGRRPRYSVADVVEEAVRLADDQGLDAVSLPRLARRLGMTQNGLYRYFASKTELLVLMGDAAAEPFPVPAGADWRANARAWTSASFERYSAHPWLLDLRLRVPMLPNALGWLECFLQGMENSGLHLGQRVQCAQLLDGHARAAAGLSRDLCADEPAYPQETVDALTPLLVERGLVQVAELLSLAAMDPGPAVSGVRAEFDFGLDRILDGIDAFVVEQRGT